MQVRLHPSGFEGVRLLAEARLHQLGGPAGWILSMHQERVERRRWIPEKRWPCSASSAMWFTLLRLVLTRLSLA